MATVRSYCPHCGGQIELMAGIDGETYTMDAEERDFVTAFPSGFVKLRKGHLVHHCAATGDKGHVII